MLSLIALLVIFIVYGIGFVVFHTIVGIVLRKRPYFKSGLKYAWGKNGIISMISVWIPIVIAVALYTPLLISLPTEEVLDESYTLLKTSNFGSDKYIYFIKNGEVDRIEYVNVTNVIHSDEDKIEIYSTYTKDTLLSKILIRKFIPESRIILYTKNYNLQK